LAEKRALFSLCFAPPTAIIISIPLFGALISFKIILKLEIMHYYNLTLFGASNIPLKISKLLAYNKYLWKDFPIIDCGRTTKTTKRKATEIS
jgi:hypothetical protein